MHDERYSDDAIGDEDAEIFADRSVAEYIFAGIRRYDKEQVKQNTPEQRLRDLPGYSHVLSLHLPAAFTPSDSVQLLGFIL